MSPTHTLTLSVTVDGPDQWENVYAVLTKYLETLGKECPNVTLCSFSLEDHFDEQTLFKVSCGLREVGVPEAMIGDAISAMQNNGILFRERD